MAYLIYTDVEKFLNINLTANGQALVNSLIDAVSEYINGFCGRVWSNGSSLDITEYFDGGVDTFFPKNTPISQITSMTIDGQSVASADIKNYGSYVKLLYSTNPGPQNVTIVYRTSANTLPADLKLALTMWISQIFKSQSDGGKTVESFSAGSISVKYLTKEGIPTFVSDIIESYRILTL